MSLAAKGTGELVCPVRLVAKSNDDPKSSIYTYIEFYSSIFNFTISSGCVSVFYLATSYCLLLTFSLAGAWSVISQ